jgi:hypothetical protein
MADTQDLTLKIRVVTSQGQFRGGTVDIEIKHRTLSDRAQQRGLDASREINIAGLRRAPIGDYQITVTPTDVFKPQSQFVNIPASGFATMTVTIDRADTQNPKPDTAFVVKGTVRTAAGVPFTNGLVRAIHQTTFGPVFLGEGKTDAQGNYLIKYSSEPVTGAIHLRVQVFDANEKLLAESDPLAMAKREEVINLTLPPPDPGVTPKLELRVFGIVRNQFGELLEGVTVQALDRDLRSEQLLGSATTAKGSYEIRYRREQFQNAEKDQADMVVKVFDAAGGELHTTCPTK